MTDHVIKPTEDTAFKRWYQKNKDVLSNRRKLKYATNPEYREKAKHYTELARARDRANRPQLPDAYTHNQSEVASDVGISPYVLRAWTSKGYLPQPKAINARRYYTEIQVRLIETLAEYFAAGGKHLDPNKDNPLSVLTSNIFANWN